MYMVYSVDEVLEEEMRTYALPLEVAWVEVETELRTVSELLEKSLSCIVVVCDLSRMYLETVLDTVLLVYVEDWTPEVVDLLETLLDHLSSCLRERIKILPDSRADETGHTISTELTCCDCRSLHCLDRPFADCVWLACKLYDYAADGLKKALPTAKIGGPETTDPAGNRAMDYLKRFLDHCRDGINYATGKKGAPLDFITFHAKGSPQVLDDHVRMNIGRQLRNIDLGFEAVASYPEFKDLPIIIGESDPEGCAACSVDYHPSNDYRNGTMYSSYSANTYARTYELARKHGVNIAGAVAWAFEFEDQKWFAGFRDLATNGVDKPVLNVFRMFGLMQGGDLVKVDASRPMSADEIVASSVRENPDVSAIASSDGKSVSIMVWNYHDDDLKSAPADVNVVFDGLDAEKVLVSQYRIDDKFSNSFETWKAIGSPQNPTEEQYRILEQSGQLQLYTSPAWTEVKEGQVKLSFSLPRQGVALVKILMP